MSFSAFLASVTVLLNVLVVGNVNCVFDSAACASSANCCAELSRLPLLLTLGLSPPICLNALSTLLPTWLIPCATVLPNEEIAGTFNLLDGSCPLNHFAICLGGNLSTAAGRLGAGWWGSSDLLFPLLVCCCARVSGWPLALLEPLSLR